MKAKKYAEKRAARSDFCFAYWTGDLFFCCCYHLLLSVAVAKLGSLNNNNGGDDNFPL